MNTIDARIQDQLTALYGSRDGMLTKQTERYARLLDTHEKTFGKQEKHL